VKKPSLAERLRDHCAVVAKKKGPACEACVLPPEAMEAVLELKASGLPATTITAALRKEGYRIGITPLRRHLRGECSGGNVPQG
jgi:hypothetical protein